MKSDVPGTLLDWLDQRDPLLAASKSIAGRLAEWLNIQDVALLDSQREVIEAMQLLAEGAPTAEHRRRLLRIYDRINLKWALFSRGIEYVLEGDKVEVRSRLGFDLRPSVPAYVDSSTSAKGWRSGRDQGLVFLSFLSEEGLLDRIRECRQCEKWFAARRRRQRFCSAMCQQEFWAERRRTAKGRKYQKERMARWRARQKKNLKHRRMK